MKFTNYLFRISKKDQINTSLCDFPLFTWNQRLQIKFQFAIKVKLFSIRIYLLEFGIKLIQRKII